MSIKQKINTFASFLRKIAGRFFLKFIFRTNFQFFSFVGKFASGNEFIEIIFLLDIAIYAQANVNSCLQIGVLQLIVSCLT